MVITYYCIVTLFIIAYLLGSIPSAVWIGKRYYGVDVREHGSKNAGTTNVLRVLGTRAAIPVFVIDFLKGFVAVSIFSLLKYDVNIPSGPSACSRISSTSLTIRPCDTTPTSTPRFAPRWVWAYR